MGTCCDWCPLSSRSNDGQFDGINPYPAEFTINRAKIGGDIAWNPIIPL